MTDVSVIQANLPSYKGNQQLLERRQDTFDIIREILNKHRETAANYDRIAIYHWKGEPVSTAQELFNFLKYNAPYKEERTYKQTVKTPAAIIAERNTFGNDCKHYASYAVGVGEALRRMGFPIRTIYRFASYNPRKKNPGHVFAVWFINGREYWIDPVPQIGGFDNRQLQPAFIIDKKPPIMSKNDSDSIGSLYSISGVYPAPIPKRAQRQFPNPALHWTDFYYTPTQDVVGKPSAKKKAKQAAKAVKKAANKAKPKKKLFSKIALAPARNAFLLLVKTNVFQFATKMWTKAAKDQNSANWKKLVEAWKKKGGNPTALLRNIKQGVRMWNKLHPKKKIAVSGVPGLMMYSPMNVPGESAVNGYDDIGNVDHLGEYDGPSHIGTYEDGMSVGEVLEYVNGYNQSEMAGIGVVAPAAAGIIAAAAPIIMALSGLLKSFGVDTSKNDEAASADLQALAENHNKAADNEDNVKSDGSVIHADGTTTKMTTNADGSQTMTVSDVPGITPGSGSSTGDGEGGKEVSTTGDSKGGGFKAMMANVGNFIKEHKTPFIVAGSVVGAIIIFKAVGGSRITVKRRR
jgi:hypothetical protein